MKKTTAATPACETALNKAAWTALCATADGVTEKFPEATHGVGADTSALLAPMAVGPAPKPVIAIDPFTLRAPTDECLNGPHSMLKFKLTRMPHGTAIHMTLAVRPDLTSLASSSSSSSSSAPEDRDSVTGPRTVYEAVLKMALAGSCDPIKVRAVSDAALVLSAIGYVDREGDFCRVSSDLELLHAWEYFKFKCIPLAAYPSVEDAPRWRCVMTTRFPDANTQYIERNISLVDVRIDGGVRLGFDPAQENLCVFAMVDAYQLGPVTAGLRSTAERIALNVFDHSAKDTDGWHQRIHLGRDQWTVEGVKAAIASAFPGRSAADIACMGLPRTSFIACDEDMAQLRDGEGVTVQWIDTPVSVPPNPVKEETAAPVVHETETEIKEPEEGPAPKHNPEGVKRRGFWPRYLDNAHDKARAATAIGRISDTWMLWALSHSSDSPLFRYWDPHRVLSDVIEPWFWRLDAKAKTRAAMAMLDLIEVMAKVPAGKISDYYPASPAAEEDKEEEVLKGKSNEEAKECVEPATVAANVVSENDDEMTVVAEDTSSGTRTEIYLPKKGAAFQDFERQIATRLLCGPAVTDSEAIDDDARNNIGWLVNARTCALIKDDRDVADLKEDDEIGVYRRDAQPRLTTVDKHHDGGWRRKLVIATGVNILRYQYPPLSTPEDTEPVEFRYTVTNYRTLCAEGPWFRVLESSSQGATIWCEDVDAKVRRTGYTKAIDANDIFLAAHTLIGSRYVRSIKEADFVATKVLAENQPATVFCHVAADGGRYGHLLVHHYRAIADGHSDDVRQPLGAWLHDGRWINAEPFFPFLKPRKPPASAKCGEVALMVEDAHSNTRATLYVSSASLATTTTTVDGLKKLVAIELILVTTPTWRYTGDENRRRETEFAKSIVWLVNVRTRSLIKDTEDVATLTDGDEIAVYRRDMVPDLHWGLILCLATNINILTYHFHTNADLCDRSTRFKFAVTDYRTLCVEGTWFRVLVNLPETATVWYEDTEGPVRTGGFQVRIPADGTYVTAHTRSTQKHVASLMEADEQVALWPREARATAFHHVAADPDERWGHLIVHHYPAIPLPKVCTGSAGRQVIMYEYRTSAHWNCVDHGYTPPTFTACCRCRDCAPLRDHRRPPPIPGDTPNHHVVTITATAPSTGITTTGSGSDGDKDGQLRKTLAE